MAVAITETIQTIADAEARFGLKRTEDASFFGEWQGGLIELSDKEREEVDKLRSRYLYHRYCHFPGGQLLEITAMLLLASPLLTIAGFYDPPFRVSAEKAIQLTLEDSEEILRGRIDALVLKNRLLWVVVLESKKTALSVWSALPQTLAYLKANPAEAQPSFGLVTNGDDIMFVKLFNQQYELSRIFSPLVSAQELYSALQILKRLGEIA